jgi:hypothetical protein
MSLEELQHLEKLMNYIAFHFLKKSKWEDVSKAEWTYVSSEFNDLAKRRKDKEIELLALGEHYFYEHLVIKRLKPWKTQKPLSAISIPNFSKMNAIASVLGYSGYMDFIRNATDNFSFNELKINIPLGTMNNALLDHLVGYWYCYNRNLPLESDKQSEERVWRSAMEIYKSGDEYLVERTGKDNHMYYGKITSYGDYVFIIMNSTTFIRQRHFIGRIKDAADKLRLHNPGIDQMNFVSTCVSFNEEPIALYEIFDRVKQINDFQKSSVDLPFDSPALPGHILAHLKDAKGNRITEH